MKTLDIFELRRHLIHMIVGTLIILGVLYLPHAQIIGFIVLIAGGFLSFISSKFKIPFLSRALCLFERECNQKFPGKGVIFFFVSALLSLQLFPENIALASIIILTFGDPVSHFIGSNFGKTILFNRRKYIEGNLSGIIVGTFFASFFVSFPLALIGCGVAMFVEAVEVSMGGGQVDDNLLIPLSAGTVMYLLKVRFGI